MRLGLQGQDEMKSVIKWLGDRKLAEIFQSIERKNFEVQARPLLNAINSKTHFGRVYSLPCIKLTVGERQLLKPPGTDRLWVDFNLDDPKCIRFYFTGHSDAWDSSTIYPEHILDASIKANTLIISLNRPGCMLTDATEVSLFPGKIIVSNIYRIFRFFF